MKEEFLDIINLIKQSRSNAIRAINAELINLYWNIGKNISVKIANAEWGDSVVSELARYIQHNEPEIKAPATTPITSKTNQLLMGTFPPKN